MVPQSQVAQEPLAERDGARLLVRDADGCLQARMVRDLPDLLPSGCLLIVNNSRVFASRLLGTRPNGGKVEVFLLAKPRGEVEARVSALGRPLRKLNPGSVLSFSSQVQARVLAKDPASGLMDLAFSCGEAFLLAWLAEWAYVPLPPYIHRPSPLPAAQSADQQRYQTVYAQDVGSVAAPTAGLHFTPQLLDQLALKGIQVEAVTLHVGAGTFLPVKCDEIRQHPMHEEQFRVEAKTLEAIWEAKKNGRKIVVVGTTSLRCLETLYQKAAGDRTRMLALAEQWQKTNLFIYPSEPSYRYPVWSADMLLTNFHQPRSTLFMLICALLGYDEALAMYRHAIAGGFRFFSYGDANLLALR